MLAKAGYGVLLYDARGRGESQGQENAAGWRWDRDVRGAVSFLTSRGIDHIGLLGLSTGAEAVVTEAASDTRVDAVVADGLQARTAADASHLRFGDRISIEPSFALAGIEIRLARGESQPRPLIDVVHEVAWTRPLLLIATIAFEREIDHVYTRGTKAQNSRARSASANSGRGATGRSRPPRTAAIGSIALMPEPHVRSLEAVTPALQQ